MSSPMPPRLVVAGTHSGVGKTTIATGLMAALRKRGHRVASAKVGPDFIDPGYHSVATGRPAQNLDSWICGAEAMAPLAAKAAIGADLMVVEGVMGLFDGASWSPGAPSRSGAPGSGATLGPDAAVSTRGGAASTAEMTVLLEAPTILVVDASAMSTSVAALVHGYHTFDPEVSLSGIILNRVGSPHHEVLLREALGPLIEHGVPVLGALHRDDALTWRDRHLGLVPVVERPAEVAEAVDRLADAIARAVDLDAIVSVARSAPKMPVVRIGQLTETRPMVPHGGSVRIAVPGGRAFSFAYPDNVARLVEAGAEVVPFDPLVDPALPDGTAGLYAGGGFPEVYAEALSSNRPLLADVRRRIEQGLVTWAECGGLLWLCRSLDGHELCGAIGADGAMTGQALPRLPHGDAQVRDPDRRPGCRAPGSRIPLFDRRSRRVGARPGRTYRFRHRRLLEPDPSRLLPPPPPGGRPRAG